jgi:hypothetical protein
MGQWGMRTRKPLSKLWWVPLAAHTRTGFMPQLWVPVLPHALKTAEGCPAIRRARIPLLMPELPVAGPALLAFMLHREGLRHELSGNCTTTTGG